MKNATENGVPTTIQDQERGLLGSQADPNIDINIVDRVDSYPSLCRLEKFVGEKNPGCMCIIITMLQRRTMRQPDY